MARPGCLRLWPLLLAAGLAQSCLSSFPRGADDGGLAEVKQRASELRELSFLNGVRSRWITRDELREVVLEELQAEYEPDYVAAYRDAYAAMGLMPEGTMLIELMVELLGDQLVGLYSTNRRTLFVVGDRAEIDAGSLDMVIVHELVHVLQHQHYPQALELLQQLRHNDDLEVAIAAGVEGDASLTMLAYAREQPLSRDREQALRFQRQLLDALEAPPRVPGVPRLIRVTQTFPYAYGTPASADAFVLDGNRGLDHRLEDPPLSALRVRFPAEAHPVEFVRLPLTELSRAIEGRGCRPGHTNVAGIVALEVLFDTYGEGRDHEKLLRRWSGDRFVHVDCSGEWELAWLVHWTDERAAAEFARLYEEIAGEIALGSPLSGAPSVRVSGRSALVVSPGLAKEAAFILEASETRAYRSFSEWRGDGCFPATGCAQSRSSRHSRK